MLVAAPPPPSTDFGLVLMLLDAVATITVVVLAVLALRRIATAAESAARSAGAAQESLRQIQADATRVAVQIAGDPPIAESAAVRARRERAARDVPAQTSPLNR